MLLTFVCFASSSVQEKDGATLQMIKRLRHRLQRPSEIDTLGSKPAKRTKNIVSSGSNGTKNCLTSKYSNSCNGKLSKSLPFEPSQGPNFESNPYYNFSTLNCVQESNVNLSEEEKRKSCSNLPNSETSTDDADLLLSDFSSDIEREIDQPGLAEIAKDLACDSSSWDMLLSPSPSNQEQQQSNDIQQFTDKSMNGQYVSTGNSAPQQSTASQRHNEIDVSKNHDQCINIPGNINTAVSQSTRVNDQITLNGLANDELLVLLYQKNKYQSPHNTLSLSKQPSSLFIGDKNAKDNFQKSSEVTSTRKPIENLEFGKLSFPKPKETIHYRGGLENPQECVKSATELASNTKSYNEKTALNKFIGHDTKTIVHTKNISQIKRDWQVPSFIKKEAKNQVIKILSSMQSESSTRYEKSMFSDCLMFSDIKGVMYNYKFWQFYVAENYHLIRHIKDFQAINSSVIECCKNWNEKTQRSDTGERRFWGLKFILTDLKKQINKVKRLTHLMKNELNLIETEILTRLKRINSSNTAFDDDEDIIFDLSNAIMEKKMLIRNRYNFTKEYLRYIEALHEDAFKRLSKLL